MCAVKTKADVQIVKTEINLVQIKTLVVRIVITILWLIFCSHSSSSTMLELLFYLDLPRTLGIYVNCCGPTEKSITHEKRFLRRTVLILA